MGDFFDDLDMMAGRAPYFEPVRAQESDSSLDKGAVGIGEADFRDSDAAGDGHVLARVFKEFSDLLTRERVPGEVFSVVTHGANSIVG